MNIKILLSACLIGSAFSAGAQTNKGYAITGDGNKDMMWMNIRQVDLSTGQVTKTIFQRGATGFTLTDVDNNKTFSQNEANGSIYPTGSFVAAAAYDRRSDKLFFIPMRVGQLRWIDMGSKSETPAFYSIAIPGYIPSSSAEEANNITRMVLGADNMGYAVTNDGNHLYRFTTGKKPSVTDLGPLVDAEENKTLSVHNKCSSWGGDMIADAFGKLYIISATRSVFVVDPSTRIATYKGTIGGLPANYTTNGAAVDADGNIVLSSAIAFEGYYRLNLADLSTKKIEGSDVVYNASDLASGNLLLQKEYDRLRRNDMDKPVPMAANINAENLVYPNPVVSNSFNILLDRNMNGNYSVVLTDLAGRALQTNRAGFAKGQQNYQFNMNHRPSKGTYLVKVYDENNNVVLSDKVVIL